MIKVIITDEFECKYVYEVSDSQSASNIVNEWLSSIDETPIYNINIEINE
jgi:hypothetical protein